MTSLTTYAEFYARDFGRAVPALLECGFEREVVHTYRYAFFHYESKGYFSLIITPSGQLFDFPAYAPDGFALFVWGLACLNDLDLVKKHRRFLEREVQRFVNLALDDEGMIRRGVLFSEAQDYAVRDSSCYSNSICLLLQRSLDKLNLLNPLAGIPYSRRILELFWNEDHFLDDRRRPSYPSGDAQVTPFWVGLGDDDERDRLDRVLLWMNTQGLLSPIPARYGTGPHPDRQMLPLERIHAWQSDAAWTSLGLDLLAVLQRFGHPRFEIELFRYCQMVERLGCFPEALDAQSEEVFQSLFFCADDSMLWAVNLLALLQDKKSTRGESKHD